MALDFSLMLQRITILMMCLASAAVELAATDACNPWESIGWAGLWTVVTFAAAHVLDRSNRTFRNRTHGSACSGDRIPPWQVSVGLTIGAIFPLFLEPLRRSIGGGGLPLELILIFGLRNLGLSLAACGRWDLCLRLSCIVSLFLTLFASTMTSHAVLLAILGLYTALGSVWLMLANWERLGMTAADHSFEVAVTTDPARPPVLILSVTVASIAGIALMVAIGPQRAFATLWELLPTSGGTGDHDPFSRGGVNDGDQEVKGQNATSTGMIDSDQFLDSPLPSLYDMINDMFGEPFKNKDQERSIALTASEKTRESKKTPADNLRPNREFSTHRQGPNKPRDATDGKPRALFEVQGRTPLYLRVVAYDRFDGMSWQEAPFTAKPLAVDMPADGQGFRIVGPPSSAIFALSDRHRIKISESPGSLVPTPPHLSRLRVGKVNEASFFAWAQEGIVRMAQRKTPSGIIIDTESRSVDPRLLASIDFENQKDAQAEYLSLPVQWNRDLANLARSWTSNAKPGWEQIDALVRKIGERCIHERNVQLSEDINDPQSHFVFEQKRGPAYQFASVTISMLRSLGYPARLASGFYVSPDRYDPWSGHTPVTKEDLHFWPEVRLPWGDWVILEPTPGYTVAGPHLSLTERIEAGFLLFVQQIWQAKYWLFLAIILIACLIIWRNELQDHLLILALILFPGKNDRSRIARTLWLLEKRSKWLGRPRGRGQTLNLWLSLWSNRTRAQEFQNLAEFAQWAAYAPPARHAPTGTTSRDVCRNIVTGWTLGRCRREERIRR